ncbi:MAG: glycosyltransferase family 25 protein [Alphaproteobacteria bacterium]|nr:glycosyltransferase family 25 protein [Alphaproteobacteria bacterium]
MAEGYDGFYINLDRHAARREQMDGQLRSLGLTGRYRRSPGVDAETLSGPRGKITAGELGCFHAHARALERARGGNRFVHVIEDDVVLSPFVAPIVAQGIASGVFDNLDVVVTETYVDRDLMLIRFLRRSYDKCVASRGEFPAGRGYMMMNMANMNFAGLTSYIVHPAALDRVVEACRRELNKGPELPIDLFFRQMIHVRQWRAACVFPFMSTIRLEHAAETTIAGREQTAASALAMALLRYSFYVDRDLDAAAREFLPLLRGEGDAVAAPAGPIGHHAFVMHILDFILSDRYKPF